MATELYQFRVSYTHNSQFAENIIYMVGENLSAGDVIHNANDLISNWMNNAHTPLLNLLPTTVYIDRYTAKRQDVAGGIDVIKQFDWQGEQGADSGPASSMQVCPIVRLIPPMGTKSAGRFFLPAIAEASIEANTPSGTWLSSLSTLMSILLAGMNDGAITWTIAVYSRKNNSYQKALDYDTSPIVGWQSRRRRPV